MWATSAVIAFMPMGSAPEDYELVRLLHRPPFLFQPADGRFHMIYAGALLPAGVAVLEAFLAGLRKFKEDSPDYAARLKVHFVGTGTSPDDPGGRSKCNRGRTWRASMTWSRSIPGAFPTSTPSITSP